MFDKLSVQDKKHLRALSRKKYRDEKGLFPVEGPKAIAEFLGAFECSLIVGTAMGYAALEEAYRQDRALGALLDEADRQLCLPDDYDLSPLSSLQHPQQLIAVFRQPPRVTPPLPLRRAVLLDGVSDPGNVGTIIRTCDWFGIRQIYYTAGTADPFSPKVVQASMGSLARTSLYPCDGRFLMRLHAADIPLLGGVLDGENLFDCRSTLPQSMMPSVVVVGNEGNGISPEVMAVLTHRLFIPPTDPAHSPESLNVAIALSVLLTALSLR